MKNLVSTYVDQFRLDRQKQLKLVAVLAALAVIVAGVVFWQLHSTGVAMSNEVFCGMEEHTHGDDCYEYVLVCDSDEEDHVHGGQCYEQVLTCGMEEHTHTVECMINENADLETADDWEATLPSLTGDQAFDVVSVAQSQVGYNESTVNFRLGDDGETHLGYTRYGAWYGSEYGDWDAMFASFCLNYAGVSETEFPEASGAYAWAAQLNQIGLYAGGSDYTPAYGDIIFFDQDQDSLIDHVGIVEEVSSNGDTVKVIEGNSDDAVRENSYQISDGSIMGFGLLPEQRSGSGYEAEELGTEETENGTTFTYTDHAVTVTIILPDDTEVPEDAVLTVTPVTDQNSDYEDMLAQAEQIITDGEVEDIRFYDIGFTAEDGNVLLVEDTAQVIIEFNDSAFSGKGHTHVLHFDHAGELTDIAGISKMLNDSGDLTSLSFGTDGFSVFAVADVVPLAEGDADLYIRSAAIALGYSGTAPFDEGSGNTDGNDENAENDIIRSFDRAGYDMTVDIDSKSKSSDVVTAVRIWFEINVEGSDIENEFYTQGFPWADHYELTDTATGHQITGYYDYENNAGVTTSQKSGLSMVVQVLAMTDGSKLQPTGEVWLEELDETGGGTGDTSEKVSLEFPVLEISAKLMLDVYLGAGTQAEASVEGTFNFDTSASDYLNYGKGEVNGRLYGYGIDLELYDTTTAKGMKGQALPSGDTITITLDLNSTYKVDNGTSEGYAGQTLNLGEFENGNYQVLFYALGENMNSVTCTDGRSLKSAEGYTPAYYYSRNTCYNRPGSDSSYLGKVSAEYGGNWNAVKQTVAKDGTTITVEISSYEITKLMFPYAKTSNSSIYYYYDEGTALEDIQRAVFSAGKLWVLQPYEYTDENGIVHDLLSEAGKGTFSLSVKDGVVDGTAGKYVSASYDSLDQEAVDGKKSVDTQVKSDDDSGNYSASIVPDGSFKNRIKYNDNVTSWNNVQGIEVNDGSSYAVLGQDDFYITSGFNWTANTTRNIMAAANALMKFDGSALAVDSVGNKLRSPSFTGLSVNAVNSFYGYLPSGENWESDAQMQAADEDDLIWYDSMQEGKTCVAVLYEYRQPATVPTIIYYFPATKMRVLTDSNIAGNVYMTCEVTRLWTVSDVADEYNKVNDANITYSNVISDTDGSQYVKATIPSVASGYTSTADLPTQSEGYGNAGDYNTPTKGTEYVKVQYENGSHSGHNGTIEYGDSLLILDYTSNVDIAIAQEATDQQTGNTIAKSIYNFDNSERVADLELTGSMEIQNGVETSSWGNTTATITVTLPEGASYKEGSARYGIADENGNFTITYTQSSTLGQEGTVSGGSSFMQTTDYATYEAWLTNSDSTGAMLYISTDSSGNTVLAFSVKGVPIQGTNVLRIYFSVELGDETNPSNDLESNSSLTFDATIHTTEDSKRAYSDSDRNEDSTTIVVTSSGSNTFTKYTESAVNEVNTDLSWVIAWYNTSVTSSAMCEILDDMPDTKDSYSDDYLYASDYHGTYEITGFQIDMDAISSGALQNLKVYYTMDSAYEGDELVLEHEGDSAKLDITWDEIKENWPSIDIGTDGSVDFSDKYTYTYDSSGNKTGVTNHVYAWAIGGEVPAGEAVRITLTVQQYGAEGGDYLTNVAYDSTGSTVFHRSSTVYRVQRTISGTVWLDEDMDGGIDTGDYKSEQRICGVRVYLQKWEETSESWVDAEDVYGEAYSVVTQAKIATQDPEDTEDKAGYYEFTDIPAGTYRVLFADNEAGGADQNYLLSEHKLTEYEKDGIPEAYNSKAISYNANAKPYSESDSQGMISNIELPELEKLTVYDYDYVVAYQNAGYTKSVPLTVSKVWTDLDGKDITDSRESGSVTVEITANPDNGNTFSREVILNLENKWTETISAMPYYDGNGEKLDYTKSSFKIEEIEGNEGYSVTIGNVEYDPDENSYSVIITNQAGIEMPMTGGPGTWIYTAAGICLAGGAAAALIYRKRRAAKS